MRSWMAVIQAAKSADGPTLRLACFGGGQVLQYLPVKYADALLGGVEGGLTILEQFRATLIGSRAIPPG